MASTHVCALVVAAFVATSAAERYVEVLIDPTGQVRVVTEDGRHIAPQKDDQEVGATQAAIAPDHRSVGWLSLSSDSYSLTLVVLTNGHARGFSGRFGEPISYWSFQEGGRQVAFKEETPHGSMGTHYELWDLSTDKRIGDYTPTLDGNGRVVARPNEPKWVQALEAAQTKPH